MKYIGGNPLFTDNINKSQNYNSLSDNLACDIAIIGGGVTGALCAYYFNSLNCNCLLLEQDLVGQLSTSICTSILEYQIDVDLHILRNLIGTNSANACFNLGFEALSSLEEIIKKYNISCNYERKDCFYYSNNKDDIQTFHKEYKARKELENISIEYFSKDSSIDKFPFPIECGLYTHNGSATFDPYLFTTSLLSSLNKEGLNIYEKTKVIDTLYNNNEVILKTSTGNAITAKKVIICTGYTAKKAIKENIATFTRTFNIVTKPISSTKPIWYNNCTIIDNSKPYNYCRSTPDNRIILGGEDINDIGYDDMKITNSYNNLTHKLKTMFPNIEDYDLDYKYNGIFADSKCSIPYIGENRDFPNHYFCLGYGSNGVLYSTFGAKLLSQLYSGINNDILNIFSFYR